MSLNLVQLRKRLKMARRQDTIKRIHVHQHNIRYNFKNPDATPKPVLIVQTSQGSIHGFRVKIDGPSELVYAEKPLSCGARVWIETHSSVEVY